MLLILEGTLKYITNFKIVERIDGDDTMVIFELEHEQRATFNGLDFPGVIH
jgi:hypothetical protein